MSADDLPDLRDPGWTERLDLGSGVAALFYGPAVTDIAIEHVCTGLGGGDRLSAPRLSAQHVIVQEEERLSITASILCPDCGLHGWITQGRWDA